MYVHIRQLLKRIRAFAELFAITPKAEEHQRLQRDYELSPWPAGLPNLFHFLFDAVGPE